MIEDELTETIRSAWNRVMADADGEIGGPRLMARAILSATPSSAVPDRSEP